MAGKETLWSMSTTIREGERIVGFLRVAKELDGHLWDKSTQRQFQILLIQHHQYLSDITNPQVCQRLTKEQINSLSKKDEEMSFSMAESIFVAKNYTDPAMRGRQSMSPLIKLGLAYYERKDKEQYIHISDVGNKLLNDEIHFEDVMCEALLKYQYPNPSDTGFKNWNTKPFINTLRLIKEVNSLSKAPKGISVQEFGIFVLSLKSYKDVHKVAQQILHFREQCKRHSDIQQRKVFIENFIREYLSDFNNPIKNCREYTDNMVRYLRLTKYIYLRGKYDHTYIDLEPRRMTEINAILAVDKGDAKEYTLTQWNNYMGTYGTYPLPFETAPLLTQIAREVLQDIHTIEIQLNLPISTNISIPTTIQELKTFITTQRQYRTSLQNLLIKNEVHQDLSKIDTTIETLNDIVHHNTTTSLKKKLSVELEKWTNVALNIIDDATLIKPNAPVGDDNEPIYTAPSGVADIECYYKTFVSICEVTMLTSRDQWFNEGQPVMRHLRAFEKAHPGKPNFCLFIAPTLHKDTINTFFMAVKYQYEGTPQKIIPITIKQLNTLLKTIKEYLQTHPSFSHKDFRYLLERCTDMNNVPDSIVWIKHIDETFIEWSERILKNK